VNLIAATIACSRLRRSLEILYWMSGREAPGHPIQYLLARRSRANARQSQ